MTNNFNYSRFTEKNYPDYKYIKYVPNNVVCTHVVISDRAKTGIISEVSLNGENETGGVFLGYIKNSVWYIVECIDSGLSTRNTLYHFNWDKNYINHAVRLLSKIYNVPLSILGFWHRHPGSMDVFSGTDMITMSEHLSMTERTGLISMLVNIDPDFRMTFYHLFQNKLMKIGYDVGDEYFPEEALFLAEEDEMLSRLSDGVRKPQFAYKRIVPLECCDEKIDSESIKKVQGENPTVCKELKLGSLYSLHRLKEEKVRPKAENAVK